MLQTTPCLDTAKEKHDMKKAIQTIRMTHMLLKAGYHFDDEKSEAMLNQLQQSISYIEKRIDLTQVRH